MAMCDPIHSELVGVDPLLDTYRFEICIPSVSDSRGHRLEENHYAIPSLLRYCG